MGILTNNELVPIGTIGENCTDIYVHGSIANILELTNQIKNAQFLNLFDPIEHSKLLAKIIKINYKPTTIIWSTFAFKMTYYINYDNDIVVEFIYAGREIVRPWIWERLGEIVFIFKDDKHLIKYWENIGDNISDLHIGPFPGTRVVNYKLENVIEYIK